MKRDDYYRLSGIPESYIYKDMDSFDNKDVLKSVAKILKDSDKGLYIYGGYGVGKTLLMTLIMKYLIRKGFSCRFYRYVDAINHYLENGFSPATFSCDCLFLDDIGKELSTEKASSLSNDIFDSIIRDRVQSCKTTFMTSNLQPKELSKRYKNSTISLLLEAVELFKIEGQDYRLG